MLKPIHCIAVSVLLLMGCRPPLDITAQTKKVAVRLLIHQDLPGLDDRQSKEIRELYSQQLCGELGKYAEVATDTSHWDPSERPLVMVQIDAITLSGYPTKTDIFQDWLIDTTLNGIVDGINETLHIPKNTDDQHPLFSDTLEGRYITRGIHKHQLEQLGYHPFILSGRLTFKTKGNSYRCNFTGWELVSGMNPLNLKDGKDHALEIRKEEGRALAGYVMQRLGSSSQWNWSSEAGLK